MADITKCKGNNCTVKKFCYRYTAEEWDRQAYFWSTPIYSKKDGCKYYYPNLDKDGSIHTDIS